MGLKELAGLQSLQSLHLDGTRVSDAGLADLIALPHLTSLGLSGARVSSKGLTALKAALPRRRSSGRSPTAAPAEAVLALGGSVHVAPKGGADDRPIMAVADLPADYFQVTCVRLVGIKKPLGGVLAALAALHDPQWDRLQTLDLSGAAVGDADLATLQPLTALTELKLARTQVTDAGLEKLKPLHALRRLVLDGSPSATPTWPRSNRSPR